MCTRQSITFFLDGYFLGFCGEGGGNVRDRSGLLMAIAAIERRTGGTDWRDGMHKRMSDEDKSPQFRSFARRVSHGWCRFSASRHAVVVAIAYGLLSPTVCRHVIKCAEPIGFL